MNDISTKMQRGIFLPKGTPPEAVETLRKAFADVAKDPEFIEDYKKVTGEEPDLVGPAEIEPLFDRMRNIDPEDQAGAEGGRRQRMNGGARRR